MTSHIQSDRFVETIIDNYPSEPNNITIVECCSGIGGDTIAMLNSPAISKVVAHEISLQISGILQNNLRSYGFDPNRYEIREQFEGVLPEWKGAVLYFDPSWIEQDVGIPFCTCHLKYIDHGIKVSRRTL